MSSLIDDARLLVSDARLTFQRRILRLSGSRTWALAQADAVVEALALSGVAVLRGAELHTGAGAVEPARHQLGGELLGLVVDACDEVDPDALGAALGAVRGGGLVIWADPGDEAHGLFRARLDRALDRAQGVITRSEAGGRLSRAIAVTSEYVRHVSTPPIRSFGSCTEDQEAAVRALLTLLERRAPPVVLTADRGRGKSSALGLFAREALRREPSLRVALTMPQPQAAAAVLAHLTGEAAHGARMVIASPWDMARGGVEADIALVDEAAGLSVGLLTDILRRYPRIAFATTVHGYEGSGQGFRIRFMKALLAAHPRTRELTLETPARWAEGDPVEAFIVDALALDAADLAFGGPSERAPLGVYEIAEVDRDALCADEALLRSLFGSFVSAHYRTSPSDLAHMLEDPGVRLWQARSQGRTIGALWAAEEGGLSERDVEAIALGRARPRGNMLPEALARHLGEPEAARARGLRVVRIAVDPEARRLGVGTRLLTALSEAARASDYAYMGAGFAVTEDVIAFWQAAGLSLVHVGTKRGRASGEVSAIALHGFSSEHERLALRLRTRFSRELPDLLRDGLRDLDPNVVVRLLEHGEALSEQHAEDIVRVRAYAEHARPYETVTAPLHRFVLGCARASVLGSLDEQGALVAAKVLQGRGWDDVRRTFQLASVPEAMRAVRRAVAALLGLCFGER